MEVRIVIADKKSWPYKWNSNEVFGNLCSKFKHLSYQHVCLHTTSCSIELAFQRVQMLERVVLTLVMGVFIENRKAASTYPILVACSVTDRGSGFLSCVLMYR